jgi:hypothetical protein
MQNTSFTLIAPAPLTPRNRQALAESLKLLPKSGYELILTGGQLKDVERAELLRAASKNGVAMSFLPVPDQVQTNRNNQAGLMDQAIQLDRALAQSQGSVICLLPQDSVLAPSLPRALERFNSDPALAAMSGEVRPAHSLSSLARLSAKEEEYYGESGLTCLAMRKDAAMQAGGLSSAPGHPDLAERLASLGRSISSEPDLAVHFRFPETWAEAAQRQIELGRRTAGLRKTGQTLFSLQNRGLLLQQLLVILLAAVLFIWLPQEPLSALNLAMILILLHYPLNRAFLKHLAKDESQLIGPGLLFCLIRPALRLAGGLIGALGRFSG